jgi:hypothetical protein
MTTSSAAIDTQWLDALHRLVGRAAHEVKGALNGVSVNLEVIRSRAEKPNAPATAVATFATAAAGQLDLVISLSDALLGLTRPAHEPVNVGAEARRIAILLGAVARADGRRLTIDDAAAFDALAATSATGSAVRLAITECLLAALETSTNLHCTAVVEAPEPTIRIESGDNVAIVLDPERIIAAGDAGIHIQSEQCAMSITFPRYSGMTERE